MRWALLVLVIGLALSAGMFLLIIDKEPDGPTSDHLDVERQVFWTLAVRNTGNRVLRNVEVLSLVPIRQRWHQRLDVIDTQLPYELIESEDRSFVRLKLDTVPPFGQREIRIEATLTLASSPPLSDPAEVPSLLDEGPLVQSDHTEIRAVASKLKGDSALESARAIHGWIDDEIGRSSYDSIDRGALNALRSRRGDCTEHAALTVALARAMEIPARFVGGYVAPENGHLIFHDFHAWAELQVGDRWIIVDTHRGQFDASPAAYIATHIGLRPAGSVGWYRFHTMEPELKLSMK